VSNRQLLVHCHGNKSFAHVYLVSAFYGFKLQIHTVSCQGNFPLWEQEQHKNLRKHLVHRPFTTNSFVSAPEWRDIVLEA